MAPYFCDFECESGNDDGICERYDQHFGAVTRQSIESLLDAADVVEGRRVLDVCTGAGYAAGLASARGAQATGLDFSASQVKVARIRYPAATFEEGDGAALPFKAETFDSVVNSLGMPHFTDPDAAICDAFRVLRRGGRFAFTVYDGPERAVGVGAIYRAVQARGTMDMGLPKGPAFSLFSGPGESAKRLRAAGFDSIHVTIQRQIWRLTSLEEGMQAILQGSARAAEILRAQPTEALAKIQATIAEIFGPYKRGTAYNVPMPVVLISGVKSC